MWVLFVCNREEFRRNGAEKPKSPDGKATKNPNKNPKARTKPQLKTPETRIGCTAKFCIQLNEVANQYYITHWEGTHTHVLNPKEDAHLLVSNRKVTPATTMMMEMNAAAGIGLRSSFEIICATTGGVENVGCTKVDHKNHLAKIRQRKMVRGEATAISEYLREKTKNSPGFWYEIEVDSEENMANIFWADQRMRDDYSCFGDLITFDTTYRTNKDYHPLDTRRSIPNSDSSSYVVFKRHGGDCIDDMLVKVNVSLGEVNCICKWWDTIGLLCRHSLTVMFHLGSFGHDQLKVLHDRYIIKRWIRMAKAGFDSPIIKLPHTKEEEDEQWYIMLFAKFGRVVRAVYSEDTLYPYIDGLIFQLFLR
ncbi:Protein FAR1-RELATED SEQUENCE 5 [Linum grandiflorum]